MVRQAFVAVALCAIAVPAKAQQPVTLTLSSEAKPIFQSGDLQGCALNFEVGRQDAEFSRGEVVYISGSLTFYTFRDSAPLYVLKLGVKSAAGGDFVAPAEAYLLAGLETNASESRTAIDGEMPGFRLFPFESGENTVSAAMYSVAKTKTLRFAYATGEGGMAAIVPIDLTMRHFDLERPERSIVDESTPASWLECVRDATRSRLGAWEE